MKPLNSYQDLAINGAPPAFDQPLHVGRPNIGSYEKFIEYTKDIFSRNWLSNNGPLVQEFEHRVADYLGVKHCVAMCNGTVALEIAIRALGLEGEVIIPSFTFIATAHALSWQGITPVFADINPETHTLDPESASRMITPRTTGIIGVHLWGHPASINELQAVADEHNLHLMFDAAHAFGCSCKNEMIGKFGECEVFSFHATKFFNTFEGGAIVTNDDELAEAMRLMRNFGFSGVDNVIYSGTNGKMTEVAAAMGLVNFDEIDNVITCNRRNYYAYLEGLSGLAGVDILPFNPDQRNNYQYIVVQFDDKCPVSREQIIRVLHAENILARKYFWPGCHNMKPYRDFFPNVGVLLPNTKKVAEKVVLLPTGTNMDTDAVNIVSKIIRLAVTQHATKAL
ncbi:MAG: aminotransferase class I/II-fold pyridoxal phosphate-dependent enzyme [Candidatus Electrothrix sp. GM3_4]|nr:aminotransferase class I/II-fold pyridoxal phosphate-dependent enzyme [Candidatus Electrothrix sp. GM3_4]